MNIAICNYTNGSSPFWLCAKILKICWPIEIKMEFNYVKLFNFRLVYNKL